MDGAHSSQSGESEIDGKAKAMIVTRSRLHAARYRLAVDRYLAERVPSGPGPLKPPAESARAYIQTRFPGSARPPG